MARKRPSDSEFVLFDVFYQDGSRTSNRKVPSADLGGLDGDTPARADQDDCALAQPVAFTLSPGSLPRYPRPASR